MKIMSLNVNRFSGREDRDYTNSITSLDKCPKANEIIAFIKGFLCGDSDNVVFLHEVPYWKGEVRDRGFRWTEERRLYQNFCCSFPMKQYEISSPRRKAYSCTLAIWNKKGGWGPENYVLGSSDNLRQKTNYANKYIELKGHNLRLMGIHAPLVGPRPFDFLRALEKYSEGPDDQKVIILGDFNIATNEWRAKERKEQMEKGEKVAECEDFFKRWKWLLETMPSTGYFDIVDPETPTYFWEKTTIDHVLVSPALKDKVTAQVIPREILELSDHAVIIVDIKE